jgi:hypothetical protein
MSCIGNLKLGQWRQLFIMSKSCTFNNLNNFVSLEGNVSEFRSLSKVQNLEIPLSRPSPPISGPKRASTGAAGTWSCSHLPQSRSPSRDSAHGRGGTGADRRRSTWVNLSGHGQRKGGVLDPFRFLLSLSHPPSPLLTSAISAHHHRPPPLSLIAVQARGMVHHCRHFL